MIVLKGLKVISHHQKSDACIVFHNLSCFVVFCLKFVPPVWYALRFMLLIDTINHVEWDNRGKKMWIATGGSDNEKPSTRPNMFNSPCSFFRVLTPSVDPLCTITLSLLQNTISQLKCFCHPVSCLKLISFFFSSLRAGIKCRKGEEEKRGRVKRGAEKYGEQQ